MKKAKLLAGLTFTFLLSACTQELLQPAFKSGSTIDAIQSAPNFVQFRELPIPENAVMDLKQTLIFGIDPFVGRLVFSAPYSQSNMFDFYMQEMPKFGWRELTAIRASKSILAFLKDNRLATLQIAHKEVIIDVSLTKKKYTLD